MDERYPVYALADITVPTRDERKEVIAGRGDRGARHGISRDVGQDARHRA